MNQFTILVLLLVVFCYCGGKYCPSVLKQNKQILLGVVGGLVLASFFGFRLEGMKNVGQSCSYDSDCESGNCGPRAEGDYYGKCLRATTESGNRNSESQTRAMEYCNNDDMKAALCGSMPDQWDSMCSGNPCGSTGR